MNLLQGKVLSRAACWTGSSGGSFLLFWCSLRLSSIASPAALPLCSGRRSWDPILARTSPPTPCHPPLTHPGRARGRGPQLASGFAWKRLSPRWRELGLASSLTVKLACSLGAWQRGPEGQVPYRCAPTPCQPPCGSTCLALPARVTILIGFTNMYPVPTVSPKPAAGEASTGDSGASQREVAALC